MKETEKTGRAKKKRLSIIIPVYNEELIINSLLVHLFSITQPIDSEIIISDGHKDSTTLRAIDQSHLLSDNIITVNAPINKGNQMNRGAEVASGDILVFLHADTCISKDALHSIPELLDTDQKSAGAFMLEINSPKKRYRAVEKLINLRTLLTKIPYGDQVFFLKREYFYRMNGFFKFPIMEDIDLMRRIKQDGGNIIIADHKVVTSERRWENEGFLRCTLRNWFIQLMYRFGAHPNNLIRYYKY